jgi:hypothetical protein
MPHNWRHRMDSCLSVSHNTQSTPGVITSNADNNGFDN